MARCKSCGANIKFIRLKSGKWNPVDIEKHSIIIDDAGKEVLITEDGDVIRGRLASYEDGANRSGYISHFATCPQASSFRGKGNGGL